MITREASRGAAASLAGVSRRGSAMSAAAPISARISAILGYAHVARGSVDSRMWIRKNLGIRSPRSRETSTSIHCPPIAHDQPSIAAAGLNRHLLERWCILNCTTSGRSRRGIHVLKIQRYPRAFDSSVRYSDSSSTRMPTALAAASNPSGSGCSSISSRTSAPCSRKP